MDLIQKLSNFETLVRNEGLQLQQKIEGMEIAQKIEDRIGSLSKTVQSEFEEMNNLQNALGRLKNLLGI